MPPNYTQHTTLASKKLFRVKLVALNDYELTFAVSALHQRALRKVNASNIRFTIFLRVNLTLVWCVTLFHFLKCCTTISLVQTIPFFLILITRNADNLMDIAKPSTCLTKALCFFSFTGWEMPDELLQFVII